jgi:RNA polymerase sigma-70 factor, ECF subfamily
MKSCDRRRGNRLEFAPRPTARKPLPQDTDPRTLIRVGSEPTDVADEAFRAYRGHVYRFLLRKTGDHHDAEELTQRVFADAAVALRNAATRPDSLLAWLYAVADRRFIDEIRRRTVARRGLRLIAQDKEAPDLTYSHEVAAALRDAIEKLPRDQRQVVVMKLLEGRPFAEIARALSTSEAACKMRLSRAIAQIRQALNAEGLGPDA